MLTIEKIFQIAKKEAIKTHDCKRQFAACLVDKNRILEIGRNYGQHPKTPREFTYEKPLGLHAEIHLLLKCDFPLDRLSIYIYGQNRKSGKPVYSRPCKFCQFFLKTKNLTKVYFITPKGYEFIKL